MVQSLLSFFEIIANIFRRIASLFNGGKSDGENAANPDIDTLLEGLFD